MFLCVICSKSNNMDNSHAAQLVRLVASEKVPQNYTPVPASVSAPTCDIIITYRFNSLQSNTASLASHIREKYKTDHKQRSNVQPLLSIIESDYSIQSKFKYIDQQVKLHKTKLPI